MSGPSGEAAAWQHVSTFLAASGTPHRAAEHYDMLSPAAMVVVGNAIDTAAAIGKDRFLTAFRQLAHAPQTAWGPRFRAERLIAWREQGPHTLLWAEITEARAKTSVIAAFLIDAGTDRLVGACLTDDQTLTAESLQARILAEFAHWSPEAPADSAMMSGLAMAFDRQFSSDTVRLLSLPEARFTCQGRGDCCRSFHPPANRNAVKALDAVDWDALGGGRPVFGPFLAGADDQGRQPEFALVAGADGACQALGADGCAVHAAVGWQPIEICQLYPYQFIETPDGIVVTTTFTCLTVGDNAGLPIEAQAAELRQRLRPHRHRLPRIPKMVPLLAGGTQLTWRAYRRLEDFFLATLANPALGSVRERLALGNVAMTLLLHRSAGHQRLDDSDIASLLTGVAPAPVAATPDFADTLMGILFQAQVLPSEAGTLLDGRTAAWEMARGQSLGDALDDELVTRFLRTVLFRKRGLAVAGLMYLWGTVVLMAALWERETVYRSVVTGQPVTRDLQMATAKRLDTAMQHTPLLQQLATVPALQLRLVDPRLWFSLGAATLPA